MKNPATHRRYPPRKFVDSGPYKYVRNPKYVGGFIVLLGFGLFEQSAAILLVTLPWFRRRTLI